MSFLSMTWTEILNPDNIHSYSHCTTPKSIKGQSEANAPCVEHSLVNPPVTSRPRMSGHLIKSITKRLASREANDAYSGPGYIW